MEVWVFHGSFDTDLVAKESSSASTPQEVERPADISKNDYGLWMLVS